MAAIREYRANPQYRKTRRAKGLGILACAQRACMREQEPKVLEKETLVELKMLPNNILHLLKCGLVEPPHVHQGRWLASRLATLDEVMGPRSRDLRVIANESG